VIADSAGRKFLYYVNLANNAPNTAPTLIVFHGWNGAASNQINGERGLGDPGWNTVFPVDYFGFNRMGSWYLGENGEYFVIDFVDRMIAELRNELGLAGAIYTYGSSMGGFGAVFHGIRHRVPVMVLDIPQTCLLGNVYGRYHAQKLRKVFGDDVVEAVNSVGTLDSDPGVRRYFDLSTLIGEANEDYKPVVYIKQSRFDESDGGGGNSYYQQQTHRFVGALAEKEIPFRLMVDNVNAHKTTWNLWDAMKLISKGEDA
jgi:pimeloyl-ACP methyl ester carboxylesterase